MMSFFNVGTRRCILGLFVNNHISNFLYIKWWVGITYQQTELSTLLIWLLAWQKFHFLTNLGSNFFYFLCHQNWYFNHQLCCLKHQNMSMKLKIIFLCLLATNLVFQSTNVVFSASRNWPQGVKFNRKSKKGKLRLF